MDVGENMNVTCLANMKREMPEKGEVDEGAGGHAGVSSSSVESGYEGGPGKQV